jgi:RecB family exonuclease
MTQATNITAWSISRLFDFEACPHRSYLRIIAKAPTPQFDESHPMVRGRRIHEEVELYISGRSDKFPSSGKKLETVLEFCKEQHAQGRATCEEKWGFTNEWAICDWFDSSVWLRMATDCYISINDDEAIIYDWKTGKSIGNEVKYMQQMQLYAVGAFMRYPELEHVDVKLGFLDDGKVREKSYQRDHKINTLIFRFTERASRMTSCVDFRPKPNATNCKWCPFGPSGTKACIYGVEPL